MMRHFTRLICIGITAFFSGIVYAATFHVSPNDNLQAILNQTQNGDNVILQTGTFFGRFELSKSIKLTAKNKATIDAQGQGVAITVTQPKTEISNLTIQNFGESQYSRDAGILVLDGADSVMIKNNIIRGSSFGIRGDNLDLIKICNNRITGNNKIHPLDRGDGIYLNRVKGPYLKGNQIQKVRDGIYLENVHRSTSINNQFSDMQYGIHYMYTWDDKASNNRANHVDGGYALMNTERIYLHDNHVANAKDFGILLNMTNDALIENNQVENTQNPQGEVALMTEGKGLFIYGAMRNKIKGNLFKNNDTGINIAMGGESNQFWLNQFMGNRAQVKYVGEKVLEWSHSGQGNYWDSYDGWDLNNDGIGDIAHRPNDSLDKLFWIYPEAQILLGSPVIKLLRWLDKQFKPTGNSGINDSYPLMSNTESMLHVGVKHE